MSIGESIFISLAGGGLSAAVYGPVPIAKRVLGVS